MPTQMTTVALQRGFKNALICLLGVLAVIGCLALLISALTEQSFRESCAIGFGVFWVAIFTAFLLALVIGRGNRGAILLDCGRHPARALFLLNAAIFAVMGLSNGFASTAFDTVGIASSLFGITFSIYWVLLSFGRLQVAENGIWQYWGLLKWRKVASYEWQGDVTPTLLLQTKTRFPLLSRGALPVPAEHKQAFSELLDESIVQADA